MGLTHGCPKCSAFCCCDSTTCLHRCTPTDLRNLKGGYDALVAENAALRKRVSELELDARVHDTRRWLSSCTPAERAEVAFYADVEGFKARAENAEARVAELEERLVLVPTPHEAALIEVDTRRGVTDCSTPLFQRVRNIVETLTQAEARAEQAEARVAEMEGEREGIFAESRRNAGLVATLEARAEQAERELVCPSCFHLWSLHHCTAPGCKREGCHGHDGSDGPCDCTEKHPFTAALQADLGAALRWIETSSYASDSSRQRVLALLEKRRAHRG